MTTPTFVGASEVIIAVIGQLLPRVQQANIDTLPIMIDIASCSAGEH